MAKAESDEAKRLRKEMQQRGNELTVLTKRAKQLMEKSPAITDEERAELERLMGQDIPDMRNQLAELMSRRLTQ